MNVHELLNSHCLAELASGERRILAKVGNSGTKILVNPVTGAWNYLSHWDQKGNARYPINLVVGEACLNNPYGNIVKVWGRVTGTASYGAALNLGDADRKLLWERKPAVKMTVAQICEKLGYEVEIVAEKEDDRLDWIG